MLASVISLVVVLTIPAPAVVEAALGKPIWSTTGMDPLQDYYASIPVVPSSRVNISPPDMCIQRASGKCSAANLKAVRVTYNDCDLPWVLCRCDNANMKSVGLAQIEFDIDDAFSMDTLVNRFSTVPAGIRSYVGGALAVAASGPSAGSSGDFITFDGDCLRTVFLHEAAHSLDQGLSGSTVWHNAVANSTCVPDDYANSSYAEDFAQMEDMYNYRRHRDTFPMPAACLIPQMYVMSQTTRIRDANARLRCNTDKRPFYL